MMLNYHNISTDAHTTLTHENSPKNAKITNLTHAFIVNLKTVHT